MAGRGRFEGGREERAIARIEVDGEGCLLSLVAHLRQCAAQHLGHLLVAKALGEFAELGLEKHETQRVFETLGFGVAAQVSFSQDVFHALAKRVFAAVFAKHLKGAGHVVVLQGASPTQVALASIGMRFARNLPALEVVRAAGDLQCLRGIGL